MKISKLLFIAALLINFVGLTSSIYAAENGHTGGTIQVNDTEMVLHRVANSRTGEYEAFFSLKNGTSVLEIYDFDRDGFVVAVQGEENVQWVEWENLYDAQLEDVDGYQELAFEDFKQFVIEHPDFFARYRGLCDSGSAPGGLACSAYCKLWYGRSGGYCESGVCKCNKK